MRKGIKLPKSYKVKDILIALIEKIRILLFGEKQFIELKLEDFEGTKEIGVYHLDIQYPAIYRNIPLKDLEKFIQTKLKDIKSLNYNDITVYKAMRDKQWNDHEINMLLRYNKTRKNLFLVDISLFPSWLNTLTNRKIRQEMYEIINKYNNINMKVPIYRYRKNYNWSIYEVLIIMKYLQIKELK